MKTFELTDEQINLIGVLVHSSQNDELCREILEDEGFDYPDHVKELTELQEIFPEPNDIKLTPQYLKP